MLTESILDGVLAGLAGLQYSAVLYSKGHCTL